MSIIIGLLGGIIGGLLGDNISNKSLVLNLKL